MNGTRGGGQKCTYKEGSNGDFLKLKLPLRRLFKLIGFRYFKSKLEEKGS